MRTSSLRVLERQECCRIGEAAALSIARPYRFPSPPSIRLSSAGSSARRRQPSRSYAPSSLEPLWCRGLLVWQDLSSTSSIPSRCPTAAAVSPLAEVLSYCATSVAVALRV